MGITELTSSVRQVTEIFKSRFGATPAIFRAPGRVNLIGDHTDYNDGFVMPVAVNVYTYVAISPRRDRKLRVYSENYDEMQVCELDAIPTGRNGHWSDYVYGVAACLQSEGYPLVGAELTIRGEVPIGAGLSSSAALEVAVAFALVSNSGLPIDSFKIAKLCQRAENEYTGARCGIMDQYISCFGRTDHAIMIDCRSLSGRALPIDPRVRIVVCNSNVRHDLAAGEYNLRREDCENSVQLLQRVLPNVRALRDVTLDQLDEHRGRLSDREFRRCRHVITENRRVQDAADAAQRGDLYHFGQLMYASHRSLRDDYEVSCKELDIMVEIASGLEGVYGARMTGGGFGGATVNLVRSDMVEVFNEQMALKYKDAIGSSPEIYVFAGVDGAELLNGAGSVIPSAESW